MKRPREADGAAFNQLPLFQSIFRIISLTFLGILTHDGVGGIPQFRDALLGRRLNHDEWE